MINKVYYKFDKIKFIDLSADFRIRNLNEYKQNYNIKHKASDLIKDSVYSISEFVGKKIKNFRIIANPGCYPTSIQLPLIPLFKKKLVNNHFLIDSKSGYSGAGKNLEKKFTHKNLYSSTFAYGTKIHRHVVEMDQEFKKHLNKKIIFTFSPHLLPTFRGILSSIYLEIKAGNNAKKIRNELIKFYKKDKFIKVLKLNTQIGSGNVLNTNNCEISVCNTREKNKIVIFSAIDNLVKGASGQAIQNMNLLFNFSETMGLK